MNPITILVSPRGYDDVNSVLQQLGGSLASTRQLEDAEVGLLQNTNFLAQYQHLFLNCHSMFRRGIDHRIITSIQGFVENGGALYASDWASGVIEAAFGQRTTFIKDRGEEGIVKARVSDPYLAQSMGRNISIHFDLGSWDLIERFPASADVYLWDERQRPLAVGFRVGQGRIVFTSFHHHAQRQDPQTFLSGEEALLQWLVTLPTQHGHILRVGKTLAQYRATCAASQVVNRLGVAPQVIPLKLGSKSGLGVFALSWDHSEGLELSMRYLRGGEIAEVEKKSPSSPLVITVRNPKNKDTVEISRSILASLSDKMEEVHPYVFGASVRRDLLGDPDWFALAIARHIHREISENDTVRTAKDRVTSEYMLEILETILTGLGYVVSHQSGEDLWGGWSDVIARLPGFESDDPDIQIGVRIIEQNMAQEEAHFLEGSFPPESAWVSPIRGRLTEGTEHLFICLIFQREDTVEPLETNSVADTIKSPSESLSWRVIASESVALGRGQDIISAKEFSTAYHLNIKVYRLEDYS